MASVTSNSTGSRLPDVIPISVPFSQTRAQESTPSNRRTTRCPRQAGGTRESDAVIAGGVIRRHARRVDGKRVPDVRVGRSPVPVQLPVRRHGQCRPVAVVQAWFHEVQRRVGPRGPAEFPVTRQIQGRRVRGEPGPGRPSAQRRLEALPVRCGHHSDHSSLQRGWSARIRTGWVTGPAVKPGQCMAGGVAVIPGWLPPRPLHASSAARRRTR